MPFKGQVCKGTYYLNEFKIREVHHQDSKLMPCLKRQYELQKWRLKYLGLFHFGQ